MKPTNKTKVVNIRFDKADIYIGRGSKWGNKWSHKKGTKALHVVNSVEEAIEEYRKDLWERIKSGEITIQELQTLNGKTLGCYCKPNPCHGDILEKAIAWAVNLKE